MLVGVTIGGIFHYVNEARKNVDIHNVNVINNALQELRMDKDFVKITESAHGVKNFCYEWVDSSGASFVYSIYDANSDKSPTDEYNAMLSIKEILNSKLIELFPDGYPNVNTSNCIYRIMIQFAADNTHTHDGELRDMWCGIYSYCLSQSLPHEGVDLNIPKMSIAEIASNDLKTYKRVY